MKQEHHVAVFESTLQKTHEWLRELMKRGGYGDEHEAYLALRAVLHALRDRLPTEVAVKLGAQLPMLIRGFYYEGWVPSQTPIKVHQVGDFLALVAFYLGNDSLAVEVERMAFNVFSLLKNHLSLGEIAHIKNVLPRKIAEFLEVS
jgi:uncharacterized protein (DUF2267 family)